MPTVLAVHWIQAEVARIIRAEPFTHSHVDDPRMYGGICELAAENGASGGCIRRPFHHNIQNVNVLKEDKMISSAFSVFSNVEVSRRPS
jgi:hypothetical protein